MINLLPPEKKQAYRYAGRNVRLVRWVVAFAFSLAGLALIVTAGLIYMHQSERDYARQAATVQQALNDQHLSQTQAQVTDISNSLKLAVQVLSKEVLFSKLITQLATVTPPNVELTDLSISKTTGAIDITAISHDYNSATQLQINLADPNNKIFTKADIVSIVCATNATNPNYPCTVAIKALFGTNNPFLFINNKGQ